MIAMSLKKSFPAACIECKCVYIAKCLRLYCLSAYYTFVSGKKKRVDTSTVSVAFQQDDHSTLEFLDKEHNTQECCFWITVNAVHLKQTNKQKKQNKP